MQCGGWSIVYIKTKTHAVVETKLSSRKSCVQQREVNDVAMLLQWKPVCSCKSTYIFFQYFLSCTSTQKKVAHRREPQKKKSRAYMRIKKNVHGKEFHIAGASMSDLASNVS